MSAELEKILDECIERLAAGESVEACLTRYPAHRDELLPLLEAAWKAMHAAETTRRNPAAKARGLYRLTQAASQDVPQRDHTHVPFWRRPVAKPIAFALVTVLLVLGLSSVAAVRSSDVVPGDSLYWVKTTKEGVSLWFPKSDADRAEMHAHLAGERGREMRVLVERGRLADAEQVLVRVRHHLARSADYAGVVVTVGRAEMPAPPRRLQGDPRIGVIRITLARDGEVIIARRTEIAGHIPDHNRERAERILRDFELSYRVMLAELEGDPLVNPFWRVEPAVPFDIRIPLDER